jgi:hypothetical protein
MAKKERIACPDGDGFSRARKSHSRKRKKAFGMIKMEKSNILKTLVITVIACMFLYFVVQVFSGYVERCEKNKQGMCMSIDEKACRDFCQPKDFYYKDDSNLLRTATQCICKED